MYNTSDEEISILLVYNFDKVKDLILSRLE
jgi:hypothetical protein